MWKNKYRIVTDNYAGYEAQVKYWWFPFIWIQIPTSYECSINTHTHIE